MPSPVAVSTTTVPSSVVTSEEAAQRTRPSGVASSGSTRSEVSSLRSRVTEETVKPVPIRAAIISTVPK